MNFSTNLSPRSHRFNCRAQIALFDALLFFVILMLASGGLLLTYVKISQVRASVNFNQDSQRCSDMLNSILVSTVGDAYIYDLDAPEESRKKFVYQATTEEIIGMYIHMNDTPRYDALHLLDIIAASFNRGILTKYGARIHFYDNDNSSNSYSFNTANVNQNLHPDEVPEVYVKKVSFHYLDTQVNLRFTCWYD